VSEVAAIVLAAGQGTRFGEEPKLLARFEGKPLVRWVAEAAVGSSARPVIAVTGHRAEDVEVVVRDLPVRAIRNPAFADGLAGSLKAGFSALPPEARAAIVLLADMPLVTAHMIDDLVSAWLEKRPVALVPTVDGRRGNPVVLSRGLEEPIRGLAGDAGAASILRGHPDVREWPTANRAFLQDVDTTDALKALRR